MSDPSGQTAGPAPGRLPAEQAETPRPIRVAWVAGPRTLEDYGRLLQPLAVGLLDELVELTAICPERSLPSPLPCPPVRVVSYGRLDWWAFWETAPKLEDLAEELGRAKVDLLHALDVRAAPLAMKLARLTGAPYLVSSSGLRDAGALSRLRGQPAGILAASAPVLKELRRRRLLAPERLHLLRPGVHQVRHATCFTDPQHSVTIVAGGAMDDLKAFQAVLRSYTEILSRRDDCALFLIGNGRAEHALRMLAEKLHLSHDLTFADWQPYSQLPEVFQAADLYVAPAVGGELDVPCLLAMAAGVPVLATGEGACDFLRNGQTAMFFRRGDADDLTAKLASLLEDRASARALADAALAHCREYHSPASAVAELARIYRQTAQNGKPDSK